MDRGLDFRLLFCSPSSRIIRYMGCMHALPIDDRLWPLDVHNGSIAESSGTLSCVMPSTAQRRHVHGTRLQHATSLTAMLSDVRHPAHSIESQRVYFQLVEREKAEGLEHARHLPNFALKLRAVMEYGSESKLRTQHKSFAWYTYQYSRMPSFCLSRPHDRYITAISSRGNQICT